MSLSVLIVEDLPEFREAISRMVMAAPDMHLVAAAHDLASGLARLDDGPIDVLLVDLGLPDGSGLTLIREAMRRWPDSCDAMVISVFADEMHVMAAIEAGATGYLQKDASPLDLVQQIRELRAGGSPISPIIARQMLLRLSPATAPASDPSESQANLLTAQEQKVLRLAAKGYTYDEAADLMGVSRHTVMTYVKRSYRKLQVNSKSEALYEVRRMGLVLD